MKNAKSCSDSIVRDLKAGERVVDVGSGAGFDSFMAGLAVGDEGHVIGIDMTPEMLLKASDTAEAMGVTNVEFREGFMEDMPVDDGWADVVISNVSISGASEGGVPTETTTFNYGVIKWEYVKQNADGSKGGKTTGGWSLVENKPA